MRLCVRGFPRSLLAAEGQVFSPPATHTNPLPPQKKNLVLLLPSARASRDDGWLHGKVVRLILTFPLNLR